MEARRQVVSSDVRGQRRQRQRFRNRDTRREGPSARPVPIGSGFFQRGGKRRIAGDSHLRHRGQLRDGDCPLHDRRPVDAKREDQATPDKDFQAPLAGTLTFAPGVVEQRLSIAITNDDLVETPTESFEISLQDPTGGATRERQSSPRRASATTTCRRSPTSRRFRRACKVAALGFGKSLEHYRDFVRKAYLQFLGRLPDESGFTYWVTLMQRYETSQHLDGLRQEQIESGFIDSPEYKGRYGGVGEAWIRGIYRDLLAREGTNPASISGCLKAGWGDCADAGAPGFTTSEERLGAIACRRRIYASSIAPWTIGGTGVLGGHLQAGVHHGRHRLRLRGIAGVLRQTEPRRRQPREMGAVGLPRRALPAGGGERIRLLVQFAEGIDDRRGLHPARKPSPTCQLGEFPRWRVGLIRR